MNGKFHDQDYFSGRQLSLFWLAKYLLLHLLLLIPVLLTVVRFDYVFIAAAVLISAAIGSFALKVAHAKIRPIARAVMLIMLAFNASVAAMLVYAVDLQERCADPAEELNCTKVQPPIIRIFNRFNPIYDPTIPANP